MPGRVRKRGGKVLIIDLRRDASREAINQPVDGMSLSPLNTGIPKLTFRFMLLKRAYTKNEFEQLLSQTKFRNVNIQETPTGFELWLEK